MDSIFRIGPSVFDGKVANSSTGYQHYYRVRLVPIHRKSQVEMDRRLFSLADEQLFPDLRGQLGTSLDQLERCQKALSDFLEEKRSAMPRFYFIGDEDLLEILGQVRGNAYTYR